MNRRYLGLSAAVALGLGLALLVCILASPPSAAAPAAPADAVSIYDIQYTTDPGGDGTYPSPLAGQVVSTTGVVYAVYSGNGFCIADASGPWHGIYVYYPDDTLPNLGDQVQVEGEVVEYYGLTELGNYATYTILSSGNPIYDPSIVTAAEIPYDDLDTSEPYESVFVELHNIEVTEEADLYGVWMFTDASAGSGEADDWGYHLEPAVGDEYAILRGSLIYWYDFVVMPRDAGDVVETSLLGLQKEAPATVEPGTLFTYTLTVQNDTGVALAQVILTDALPLDVEIDSLSDGGVHLGGNVVSWTIPSLAVGAVVTRTAAVTAPSEMAVLLNDDYVVWADNWPTPTAGPPVSTLVSEPGAIIFIHLIQGSGLTSPLDGYTDLLVEGVVVGDFQDTGNELGGFFLQEEDEDADGDPATSEGIFVHDDGFGVDVEEGDLVSVQGDVIEVDGQTEIENISLITVNGSGLSVSAATVDLPLDAIVDLERYEGMLIVPADELYVTEHYDLGHYGQVWVSVGGRLYNPTHLTTPGAPANEMQDLNDRSRLLIDDGSLISNPAIVPYLAPDNTLRLGDMPTNLIGALSEGADSYRLQPTAPLTFTRQNERSEAPSK
jgi:uncharacterized repeat protein (TIGR01451 family)